MLKRCFAFLLVLLLLVGLFPTAFAEGTGAIEETAPEEIEGSEEIVPETEEPGPAQEDESCFPEDDRLLDNDFALYAGAEITGAPNAFANLTLPSGGIDIPAQGYIQHKKILPLYSVYLKNQAGYANNYYVAYCIEPGVELGNQGGHGGTSYTIGEMEDGSGAMYRLSREKVLAIGVALMYGQREIASKKDEQTLRYEKLCRHAATQAIIWELACGWRSPTPPYPQLNSTLYDAITLALYCASSVWGTNFYLDGMDDAYRDIEAKMAQHYTIPSFMSESRNAAPKYTLLPDGNGKFSISLTDTDGILGKYSFSNTSNLTFTVQGNILTVTANSPISETIVAPTKQIPSLDNQVFFVWEHGEQQKMMSCKTEPDYQSVPAYFSVTVPPQTGALSLMKTTEDGANLAGWQFGIYSDSGCTNLISGVHTTDANGALNVSDLSAGTVYVKELGHQDAAIQEQYSCSGTNPQMVTILADETVTVQFHNRLNKGSVKLVKTTNTGENLSGWKIDLFRDADCTDAVPGSPFITGTDGTVVIADLLPGTYFAREQPGEDGYWDYDTAVKPVTVAANQAASVTFRNIHYGKLKIRKTVSGGGSVEGWQFKISDVDGNTLGGSPFTTDKDGLILTGNLLPGTYTVEELLLEDSPYQCISQNPQTVTVKQGQTAEATFTNILRTGSIRIEKINTAGEHLSGATFLLEWSAEGALWYPVIYSEEPVKGGCSNPNLVDGTLTTGDDGVLLWDNLYPGLFYRVTELKAPNGYQKLPDYAFVGELPEEDLQLSLQVVNAKVYTLPETGVNTELFMRISRISCAVVCAAMLFISYRKKRS